MGKIQVSVLLFVGIGIFLGLLLDMLMKKNDDKDIRLTKIAERYIGCLFVSALAFCILSSSWDVPTGNAYIGWVREKNIVATGASRTGTKNGYVLKIDIINQDSLGKGPLNEHGLQEGVIITEDRAEIMQIITLDMNYPIIEYANKITGEKSFKIKKT